jgi:hypothetical protein
MPKSGGWGFARRKLPALPPAARPLPPSRPPSPRPAPEAGGRVIYFYSPAPEVLVLLALYAKNERENLSRADLEAIRAAEVRAALRRDDPAR